jgi:SAM-dependent methyltransferase
MSDQCRPALREAPNGAMRNRSRLPHVADEGILAVRSDSANPAGDDLLMLFAPKNWDRWVGDAEQLARGPGLQAVRDRILELAAPVSDEAVVDVGAGTGLLALALADSVRTVWALDSSQMMGEYLRVKAESAGIDNIRVVHASATSIPLVDGVADLAVSNYCFHEMTQPEKLRALAEVHRVLHPGGRLVIADMMFGLSPLSVRDRRIVVGKLRIIGSRGLPGLLRVLKNATRLATGRWEHPQDGAWWHAALERCGFEQVSVELLSHEGGIASARRPLPAPPSASTRAYAESRGNPTVPGALDCPRAPRGAIGSRETH